MPSTSRGLPLLWWMRTASSDFCMWALARPTAHRWTRSWRRWKKQSKDHGGKSMKRSLLIFGLIALFATAAVATDELALPAGTGVKMKLETALSTSTTKVGDGFSG